VTWSEKICAALVAMLLLSGGAALALTPDQPAVAKAIGRQTPNRVTIATGAPTSTIPPPTTSSSTSTSTTTSTPPTTQAPTPPVRPAAVRPATPVTKAPAPSPPPSPSGTTVEQRCRDTFDWVVGQGLPLPGGWQFRCPDPALDPEGRPHWGLACSHCATGSFVAINVDLIGSSDATLRYVVAHEICHAIEYATLGLTTEITADLCAALHGAPRP